VGVGGRGGASGREQPRGGPLSVYVGVVLLARAGMVTLFRV
jgi:hypothetical protein